MHKLIHILLTPESFKDFFFERSYHNLNFIKGCSWFKFNNLELALRMTLKFYTSAAKGLKLKVRKFLGLIPTSIVEKGEKLIKGAFLAPSILNRFSCVYCDFFEVWKKV